MTEAGWNSCTDPQKMLLLLRSSEKASDRKLRLFDVACCRRVWHLMTDERSRRAVDAAEDFADGFLTQERLAAIREAAHEVFFEAKDAEYAAEVRAHFGDSLAYSRVRTTLYSAAAARVVVSAQAGRQMHVLAAYEPDESQWNPDDACAVGCSYWAAAAVGMAEHVRLYQAEGLTDDTIPNSLRTAHDKDIETRRAENAAQTDLVRDIFGLVLFRPGAVHPDIRAWNDRLVVRLAQAIYDERRWGDMPILADALLDAGADDEELLAHLRSEGPHVRGCWALDLILGKE
jgi:hypothetical protein